MYAFLHFLTIYHINKIKSIIIYFTNSNNEYDIFNLCNKILNLLEKQKGKKTYSHV